MTHRLLAVSVAAIALAACQSAPPPSAQRFDPYLRSVADAAPQLDYAAALQTQRRLFEESPGDARVAIEYARTARHAGALTEARSAAEAAVRLAPDDVDVLVELGKTRIASNMASAEPVEARAWALAEEPLRRALVGRPNHPSAISALGVALSMQRRYPEAIAFYEESLAANPGNIELINNLAVAYGLNGDVDRGLALLKTAPAGAPDLVKRNVQLLESMRVGKLDMQGS